MKGSIRSLLVAFLALATLCTLFALPAFAGPEEVRVARIQNDPTLINQEVLVVGTVEQIETLGEGMTRGRFILRDANDGQTILVESDHVPAPGLEARTFHARVMTDAQTKRPYLKHLGDKAVSSGWQDILMDPITIIAVVFLLLMGFLVYYLLRSDKQTSVSVNAPAQQPPYQQPEFQAQPQAAPQPEPAKPVAKETLDSRGTLVIEECTNTKLVGQKRSVVLRNGQGILGRGDADINIEDDTFSSRSAMIKDDPGTRSLVIQNIKKGRTLYVTSSSGDKTTLHFNEEVQLESGDEISQEKSGLKLRYEGFGPKKTQDA
ncbi:FHA domain-containing protein [Paucidesulfovibrio longus]|uniref:hypothetical protein n=1 Tax=Paucidesulfovibrio longus TaxID=889 RepID=UPI0003B4B546|nr:hypothetical protein [Paucidesulfovibrio longus]